jgi:hypothetical protein
MGRKICQPAGSAARRAAAETMAWAAAAAVPGESSGMR